MFFTLFKRVSTCLTVLNSRFQLLSRGICSGTPAVFSRNDQESTQQAPVNNKPPASTSDINNLSPLFDDRRPHFSDGCDIELVDNDTWQVSSGLAHAWRVFDMETKRNSFVETPDEAVRDNEGSSFVEGDMDFDEIDNMRIQGNLFYKIDRGSKEFEEYNYDFHRKKSSKRKEDNKDREKKENSKNRDDHKESKKNENQSHETVNKVTRGYKANYFSGEIESFCVEKKKERTLTFNQLTAPYHYPFCLDIYISKASVRACIIHRATSKVVAVAHSISKDMKFDLASTRNAKACAAVGGILAQRALADDIHDVIYTPRKGEKLEGKLQIVLQAIIDNGVNVKVKLKQRKIKRTSQPSMT